MCKGPSLPCVFHLYVFDKGFYLCGLKQCSLARAPLSHDCVHKIHMALHQSPLPFIIWIPWLFIKAHNPSSNPMAFTKAHGHSSKPTAFIKAHGLSSKPMAPFIKVHTPSSEPMAFPQSTLSYHQNPWPYHQNLWLFIKAHGSSSTTMAHQQNPRSHHHDSWLFMASP